MQIIQLLMITIYKLVQ